ncbi:unnamed protein product [Litomosoides sigmodontis]|uniref:Uncharacterized protein n=1 Tax=Litomosoides sigmodontis TaxID=42156 RepID=A0A3P7K2G9_LITSI|nr:unnamed protein product [Litomosoides sigmodontis]
MSQREDVMNKNFWRKRKEAVSLKRSPPKYWNKHAKKKHKMNDPSTIATQAVYEEIICFDQNFPPLINISKFFLHSYVFYYFSFLYILKSLQRFSRFSIIFRSYDNFVAAECNNRSSIISAQIAEGRRKIAPFRGKTYESYCHLFHIRKLEQHFSYF